MPSPFPGMDPYLEDPAIWPDVHAALIYGMREALVPQVRPKYAVRMEQRVYVSHADDPAYRTIVPDLKVIRDKRDAGQPAPLRTGITAPVAIEQGESVESTETRIEIIDQGNKSVVTVIELLSPANKVMGSEARRSFVEKRRQILATQVHWMEFDLLRAGTRTINPSAVRESDYLVYLNRAEANGRRGLGWPFDLTEPMPIVGVPLGAPDEDVALDLHAVLQIAYDRAGYDVDLDYTQQPVPPLSATNQEWAEKLLPKNR